VRRTHGVIAMVLLSLAVAACGQPPERDTPGPTSTDAPGAASFRACMVSDAAGLDDRSFNEAAWRGLQQAQADLGVQASFVESRESSDYGPNIDALVSQGCGLIVTVGFLMGDATRDAAFAHPEQPFAIVDTAPDGDPSTPAVDPIPNVQPLLFDTGQAAFLAGYLAAGMSRSGRVATFGAVPLPPVKLTMDGFADGVRRYNTDNDAQVQVLGWNKARQNGTFTGDFEDQSKGKQVANNLIQQGVDIILPVAGQVGLGAAAAARDAGDVSLIWVDTDGVASVPRYADLFLTSVLKRIDAATFAATQQAQDGTFSSERYLGTLENDGVGLAPFHEFEDDVPEQLKAEIDALRDGIVNGEVVVESPSAP